ncbi:MAG: EAL domain-containing protein, partial [Actinomycetota bacterium]
LGEQEQSEAVIGGVVILARTLGLETVAEGVERAEQVPRLHDLGCDMTQGYHHHHPMSGEELAALLDDEAIGSGCSEEDAERRHGR